jgi:hypothetical protein
MTTCQPPYQVGSRDYFKALNTPTPPTERFRYVVVGNEPSPFNTAQKRGIKIESCFIEAGKVLGEGTVRIDWPAETSFDFQANPDLKTPGLVIDTGHIYARLQMGTVKAEPIADNPPSKPVRNRLKN